MVHEDREEIPELFDGEEVPCLEGGEPEEGGPSLSGGLTANVLNATPEEVKEWQQADEGLSRIRELAKGDAMKDSGAHATFYYREGLLYRNWRPHGTEEGGVRECEQLVLPQRCRDAVLHLAHEVPMAGHLGITKTKDRILQRYYWPGIFKDIAQYCCTCEVCQRSTPQKPLRAEMIPLPLISQPFQRIAMDLVGPLPKSRRGNRFILTIVDYATRYPEAIPLSSTEASRIAKELVTVFSRTGIPEEILSDQGANFMSMLLQEMYQLLHIRRIRTSPYHPQTDGLVERFNGTMKGMLRKFVGRGRKDWDEYLPYLLFAYREVPQASTGFSPFELLYGRKVRGPLDVLKEAWTGAEGNQGSGVTQIVEMRQRMEEMMDQVQVNANRAQSRQKRLYDRGAHTREFAVGDQVLILLPQTHHSLKLEWVGPYKVTRRVTTVDYEVVMPGRRKERRVYHINLMKKWNPQSTALFAMVAEQEEDDYFDDEWFELSDNTEGLALEDVNADLPGPKRAELLALMKESEEIFRKTPGRTTLAQHMINTGSAPIRQKPYRLPYSQREVLKKELDEMLEAGVIRPSVSPWAAPIVLVPKKDGGQRLCIDYRKLNATASFDAYPMPQMEEIFESIGRAKVISTLDLAKGYWQIPLSESSREKTAFTTTFGLFEFEVMPFGLHSTPATFQRLMNYVLRSCESYAKSYIDDIAVYSQTWEEHLEHLGEVFRRLVSADLHVKLVKCHFGVSKVHYLGHVIGQGEIEPDQQKIAGVQSYPVPATKKNVRAFLGLVGYYRRFVPDFASIATPLTNLTKKRYPEKVVWDDACEGAFQKLKAALVAKPVLKVADPTEPFVLQTDASNFGLGAVLSQNGDDGCEHPVAYASRKLLPREVNYAVVEKECLAIVWALKFFHVYLYGQEFAIETDHKPLSWLDRMKSTNARLTRWSLQIQPYRFEMRYRKGTDNGNADGLSRSGFVEMKQSFLDNQEPLSSS